MTSHATILTAQHNLQGLCMELKEVMRLLLIISIFEESSLERTHLLANRLSGDYCFVDADFERLSSHELKQDQLMC